MNEENRLKDEILNRKNGKILFYWLVRSADSFLIVIDPYFNYLTLVDVGPAWAAGIGSIITDSTKIPNWALCTEVDLANEYNDDFDQWFLANYPEFSTGNSAEYTTIGATSPAGVIEMIVEHAMKIWNLAHQPIQYINRDVEYNAPETEIIPLTVFDYRPKNAFIWEYTKIVGYNDGIIQEVGKSWGLAPTLFPELKEGILFVYQDIRIVMIQNIKYVVKLNYEESMQAIIDSSQVEIISTFDNWYLDNLDAGLKEKTHSETDWPAGKYDTQFMFNIGHYIPNYLLIDYKLTERVASNFGYGLIICRVANNTRNPVFITALRRYAINNVVIIPDWLAFAREDYRPVNPMLIDYDALVQYMKQFMHALDNCFIYSPKDNQFYWYKTRLDLLRNDSNQIGLTDIKFDSILEIGQNDELCVMPTFYNMDFISFAATAAYAGVKILTADINPAGWSDKFIWPPGYYP